MPNTMTQDIDETAEAVEPDSASAPACELLAAVRARIAAAASRAGRDPRSVCLVAVSKTVPAGRVAELAACGQSDFGENYVQEALGKIRTLRASHPQLCWHFIGPLQSNKTRDVAEAFDWVHSVDRLQLAQRLSRQRPASRDGRPLAPLQICLQVNISAESSKSGVAPDDLPALARQVADLPNLRLRGLMCIPAPADGEPAQRAAFARLRDLAAQLRSQGLELDALSMGMSGDLEAAVLEGATMVRIGSALFGARPPRVADAGGARHG